jgi:hypothetical protein
MPSHYYCQACGGSLTVGEYGHELCDECEAKLTRETVRFFKFKDAHRDFKHFEL